MSISLDLPANVAEVADRTREFVRTVVTPIEQECDGVLLSEETRIQMQDAAKRAGIFVPHMPSEHGGLGLNLCDRGPVFEEAGYSLLGPLALNIAAPDEGNMHLLDVVATEEQKDRYLGPLASGHSRSCFAMTEPAPGAGSDPAALATCAERVGSGWRIDGRKWFVTGADGADFMICMARTSGEPGEDGGATMFLVDLPHPGVRIVRHIGTLDGSQFGGHCEVALEGCRVSDDAVLGEVDEGYRYAQVRLGPARLTHCMRWLGIARRSQDIALAHTNERQLFGSRLADLGLAQQLLADNEIDIHATRALVLQACWELDSGSTGAQAVSMAKTFAAEAIHRVVDRSLQLCGALGVSDDLLLSRYLREVRPFRIYDGSSETHRWAIAQRASRRAAQRAHSPASSARA